MSATHTHKAEWAVIGGGLMGQLTALALVQQGHEVVHFYAQAPNDPRTSGIMASSIALLKQLKLWKKIAAEAYPLTHIRLFDGTDHIVRAPEITFAASEIGLEAFGYNIVNRRLLELITEELGTFKNYTHLASNAESLTHIDGLWKIDAHNASIKADYIAACDGRHSPSRHAAQIEHHRTRLPQSALVATLKIGRDHTHCSSEFHFEHGPLTLVPAQDGIANLVWVDDRDQITHLTDCDEATFVDILHEKTLGLLGPYELNSKRHQFPLEAFEVKKMAQNNVFLIGEAGHVLPPLGAQGLNLGMRDLNDLLGVLQLGSDEARMASYNQNRQADLKQTHFGTMTLNQLMLDAHMGSDLIKASGLALMKRSATWRQWLARKGVGVTQTST